MNNSNKLMDADSATAITTPRKKMTGSDKWDLDKCIDSILTRIFAITKDDERILNGWNKRSDFYQKEFENVLRAFYGHIYRPQPPKKNRQKNNFSDKSESADESNTNNYVYNSADIKNHLKTLGLENPIDTYTKEDINRAYKRKALLAHPDKAASVANQAEKNKEFQEISSARDELRKYFEFKEEMKREKPVNPTHTNPTAATNSNQPTSNDDDSSSSQPLLSKSIADIDSIDEEKNDATNLAEKPDLEAQNLIVNIKSLVSEINNIILGLHQKTSSFGINTHRKAQMLANALLRAEIKFNEDKSSLNSLENFLNYRENNKPSINDALAYHRIGFFGKPKSLQTIEEWVNNHSQPKMDK